MCELATGRRTGPRPQCHAVMHLMGRPVLCRATGSRLECVTASVLYMCFSTRLNDRLELARHANMPHQGHQASNWSSIYCCRVMQLHHQMIGEPLSE